MLSAAEKGLMEIIGGYAFGYIERYEALVKHVIKKK